MKLKLLQALTVICSIVCGFFVVTVFHQYGFISAFIFGMVGSFVIAFITTIVEEWIAD